MIHVVLRTCDQTSLQSERIVDKKECVIRCLNSIVNSLKEINKKHLHIIDDTSSNATQEILKYFANSYDFISINFLPKHDNLNIKQKSRYSVKFAYDYIYQLPDNDLVYIVEDDYLHFPSAIADMIDTWHYLSKETKLDVGIFPQNFSQLYYHPNHLFNHVYCKPCLIVPCKNRYYRTTWYTHESFMVQSKIFKKFKQQFDSLQLIGSDPSYWEGNTISNVWTDSSFLMFMPLDPLVIHMSTKNDVPFFMSKETVIALWEQNKTSWSLEQDSQVQL